MKKYFLRLDDACEKMDIEKWSRIEELLDKHQIKPLVGVIPHCEDFAMDKYPHNDNFWKLVDRWTNKGWIIAMHGYNHVYSSNDGGINPVNNRSEFAGLPLNEQKNKIRLGIAVFKEHGIEPTVFFAPSHTFDKNTLIALKDESKIKYISDTIAWNIYKQFGFVFIPQQSGKARKLPFKIITVCLHPNSMGDKDFVDLDRQIKNLPFVNFETVQTNRKKTIADRFISWLYFARRKKTCKTLK